MNAKRRTLAVLAAVIAVLGLALWALNRSTAAEEAASSAAADGTIPLCSFSTADLSRITYTYNGQTLTLDDADGSWTLAEDSDYHLDESACNTMVTALSSLNVKRQLDAQAGAGKTIFGGGLLLSERAAAERAAAERAAAERAAATVWELSERERRMVAALGEERDELFAEKEERV